MAIMSLLKPVGKFVVKHSNALLTATAVTGVATTAMLVAKEAPIARDRLEDLYSLYKGEEPPFVEKVKTVAPIYLPAVGSGVITCACIVGNAKIESSRNALLAAAYAGSEKALAEYQNKVCEMFGKDKEREVRKEIAEDTIKRDIQENGEPVFINTGKGNYPCYDKQFDRYFYSSIETIKKAVNEVNAKVNGSWDGWCRLNYFYEMLNLPGVMFGDSTGFNHDNPMDIYTTDANYTGLPISGQPTFVLEFVRKPVLYNGKRLESK